MTLVVVGLDAADYRLVKHWDLDNLLLDTHGKLETFAHTKDIPITAEVWPAIATGRLPVEGGESGQRGSDWSGAMAVVNRVAKQVVPQSLRAQIGQYLRAGQTVEDHFLPASGDHAFDGGVVYNWPGLTPAKNWARSEVWLERLHDGEISDADFFRVQMGLTGEEIGWALAMADAWYPIVATRCHVLDHAGHAWPTQPQKLRRVYDRVDSFIEVLRNAAAVSNLVICSDHGMETSATQDSNPGRHSWDAMFATSMDASIPSTVGEVRDWLDEHRPESAPMDSEWQSSSVETPEEHLRDLGYIE